MFALQKLQDAEDRMDVPCGALGLQLYLNAVAAAALHAAANCTAWSRSDAATRTESATAAVRAASEMRIHSVTDSRASAGAGPATRSAIG